MRSFLLRLRAGGKAAQTELQGTKSATDLELGGRTEASFRGQAPLNTLEEREYVKRHSFKGPAKNNFTLPPADSAASDLIHAASQSGASPGKRAPPQLSLQHLAETEDEANTAPVHIGMPRVLPGVDWDKFHLKPCEAWTVCRVGCMFLRTELLPMRITPVLLAERRGLLKHLQSARLVSAIR